MPMAVWLLGCGAASLVPGAAGQNAPPPPTTSDSPTRRDPPARRKARPIHDSIERAIDEVLRKYEHPCSVAARRGVPCFPTSVEVEGPRFSVAEALRRHHAGGGPAESAPITPADTQRQMSGAPLSASGGASLDPVCAAKSLIRRITGQPSTFYLYRLSDGREARPVLTDRKLDPAVHASNPDARYEFLGQFSGECEAIAAWRRALREAVYPPAADQNDLTIGGKRPAPAPEVGPPPP
jgi:hypothetical protein